MEKEIKKEFNLSEKITHGLNMQNCLVLNILDIKEFIRRLKEDFPEPWEYDSETISERIDKLCGEKLR